MKRRQFLGSTAAIAMLVGSRNLSAAPPRPTAKYTLDLCPGRIGVSSNQRQTIALAKQFGFQSVEPFGSYLASLSTDELDELSGTLKSSGLVWGAAGLDVNFRGDENEFQTGMKALPATAAAMQRAGVNRVGTWISPSHNELTYLKNFEQHTNRLRQIANVFQEFRIRFGLEYVGPKKSWTAKRYAFIHTMRETKELIAATEARNLGIVLDSWHWYCAGEMVDDLMTLTNANIVAVDLNDAPAGIERDQQVDSRRELPMATGVIDLKLFLEALDTLNYDGPVRAEPFNQALNALDDEEAVKATAVAMNKAFSL